MHQHQVYLILTSGNRGVHDALGEAVTLMSCPRQNSVSAFLISKSSVLFSLSVLPLHIHAAIFNYKTKHDSADYCLPIIAKNSVSDIISWMLSIKGSSVRLKSKSQYLQLATSFHSLNNSTTKSVNMSFISDLNLSVFTSLLGPVNSFCRIFLRQCLFYLSAPSVLPSTSPLPCSCVANTSSTVIFTHKIFPCW